MTASQSPPGYITAHDAGTTIRTVELFIGVSSVLLGLDQLLIIQPNLYFENEPGSLLPMRAALVGCGVLGWLSANRIEPRSAAYLASIGLAVAGPLRGWAFLQGQAAAWLATAVSGAAMIGVGAWARRFKQLSAAPLNLASTKHILLSPAPLGFILLGLCVGAVLSNLVGTVRASLAIAGATAAAAMLIPFTRESAPAIRRRAVLGRWFGGVLMLCYAAAALAVESRLPLHLVTSSSHPIVALTASERCSLEITAGQGAMHLFVDGELRISTFDEKRWAESMVLPALARVRQPVAALVLSTGEGIIERELLRDSGINSVVSVVRCRLVPDAARRSTWLRKLTRDALNSPRVSVIERDPAAYLASTEPRPFDVIVVDLPDPSGPLQSKYYSKYFYEQLAARMSADSILVVQATSARRSPRTFATISATLEAAGLVLQPAVVPLISRGEWNLLFAAKQRFPAPVRPEWLASSLESTTPKQFFHPWPDTFPPTGFVASPSTLYDAKALHWFERESESTELRPNDFGSSPGSETEATDG
ncbi:MAG: hypothetical protein ACM3ZE_27955 [Myxococcales bacterium]